MRSFILLTLISMAPSAFAGYIEVGASVNYRQSKYDDDNYLTSLSYTGTFSYYFWEMCAFEVNYTTGTSKQVSQATATDPKITVEDSINMVSGDFVFSFADRQAPFRPYVKLGGGYLSKLRYGTTDSDSRRLISKQEGFVPSGGLGVSISITKELSFKLGVDAWTSPVNQDTIVVDYVGRAGISWMF